MLHQIPLQLVEHLASYRTDMWPGVILLKGNHALSELVSSFFENCIMKFDQYVVVYYTVDSMSAFKILFVDNSTSYRKSPSC